MRALVYLSFVTALLCLPSCRQAEPVDAHNVCLLLRVHPQWVEAAKNTEKRWHTPASLMFAIIYVESRFRSDARPPYTNGVIHWFRKSSARGYAQALTSTWRHYLRSTGRLAANRENMADSLDFIGWYLNQSRDRLKLHFSQSFEHYLAYHEGWGGYSRKTYRNFHQLLKTARIVAKKRALYHSQLTHCRKYNLV